MDLVPGWGNQLVLRAFAAHDDDDVLVGRVRPWRTGVVYREVATSPFPAARSARNSSGFLVVVDDFDAVFHEEALLVGDDKLDRRPNKVRTVDLLGRRGLRVSAATKEKGAHGNARSKRNGEFHWHSPGERNQGAPSLSLSSDHSVTGHWVEDWLAEIGTA